MKTLRKRTKVLLTLLCVVTLAMAQTPYDSFVSTSAKPQLGSDLSECYKVVQGADSCQSKNIAYDKETAAVNIYDNNERFISSINISPMNTKFINVDPMADKYPGWSAYVYCANNPLVYLDPSGKYFVDKDGNPISYTDGKLGDNASDDLRLVQAGMGYSKTGQQQFELMANSKHSIRIDINRDEKITKGSDGNPQNGNTKPAMILDRANPTKVDFDTKPSRPTVITLNQSAIQASTQKGKSNDGLGYVEALGITAVHESLHATDKDNLNTARDAKTEAKNLYGGEMPEALEDAYEAPADQIEDKAREEVKENLLNELEGIK